VRRGKSCVRETIFRSVASGRTPLRGDRRTHYVKSQSAEAAGRAMNYVSCLINSRFRLLRGFHEGLGGGGSALLARLRTRPLHAIHPSPGMSEAAERG